MASTRADSADVVSAGDHTSEQCQLLRFSVMASVMDTDSPRREETSWPDFRARFKEPEIRGDVVLEDYLVLKQTDKRRAGALKDGPCFCPAIFRPDGRRCNADVEEIDFFVGDLDNDNGPVVTRAFIEERLAGLEYLAHTSYSHSALCDKWRVVLPLKRSVTAGEFPAIFAHMNALLKGELDRQGKTPSQPYFFPSCPPDAVDLYDYFHCDGAVLDPEQLTDLNRSISNAVRRDIPSDVDINAIPIPKRMREVIRSGNGNQYKSRSEAVFGVVSSLIRVGYSTAEIISICTDNRYGISAKPLEQTNPGKYVERAVLKVRETPDFIKELNRRHAVVMVAGKCVILNEEIDPISGDKGITLSSPTDLRTLYANRQVSVDGTPKPVTNAWLTHRERRQYDGIVFAPGRDTPKYYNLWQGFAVEPIKGDCSLFIAHIKDNIARCDDDVFDYIINWLADAVQNPGERPGTSLVLRGKQGTGKGVMVSEFGRLFGAHFKHIQHARHLTGHFNAHLKDAAIVFADEAFWAGDKANEGALKAMITEETLPIEFKGKDVIYVKNHIRLIVASNSQWLVPAGLEERRFFVVDVGEAHMQDTKYFKAIIDQMDNGGREALLNFLLNEIDLTDINLREFPQTDALREQKLLSMDSVEKFWFECLCRGSLQLHKNSWTSEITCNDLHEEYITDTGRIGQNRKSTQTELGMGLARLCPLMQRVRKTANRPGGRRQHMYQFPGLDECRRAFATITNCEWPWPAAESPELPRRHREIQNPTVATRGGPKELGAGDQPSQPDLPEKQSEQKKTGFLRRFKGFPKRK